MAWARDFGIFSLRPREPSHEPPERLLDFFDQTRQKLLSRKTLILIDVLLTGDLSQIRSETVDDNLRISSTALRG